MERGEKNTVATANCAAIDLLCDFIWFNFGVLGSIPEIKQSPSGTLISYASVAVGWGKNKICQCKASHWSYKTLCRWTLFI